jgi:hypothetical protein
VHPGRAVSVGEAADSVDTGSLHDRAQQFAEHHLPLTAHKVINVHFLVGFWGQARIVPSHYDRYSGPENAD